MNEIFQSIDDKQSVEPFIAVVSMMIGILLMYWIREKLKGKDD